MEVEKGPEQLRPPISLFRCQSRTKSRPVSVISDADAVEEKKTSIQGTGICSMQVRNDRCARLTHKQGNYWNKSQREKHRMDGLNKMQRTIDRDQRG